MEGVWDQQIAVVTWVQGAPHWLGTLLRVITEFGVAGLYLAAAAVLYWCVAPRLAMRLALVTLSGAAVISALKLVTHGPRPYWLSPAVRPYATEPSFGLPSGHSATSAAAWSLLAARSPAPRGRMWAFAALIIALVGLSRVYLGVHFPTDVLGGWLVGFALVALLVRYEKPAVARWRTLPPVVQLLAAVGISLIPVLTGAVADAAWGHWHWPPGWHGHLQPGDLQSLRPVASAGGGLFGLVTGLTWLGRRGGHRVTGGLGVRAARLVVGLAGVGLLWYVTGLVPGATSPPGEYVRYALAGVWVTAGAPCAFAALGLRERVRDGQ